MRNVKIALRNLGRQKKRTVLLGGAIGFGVMVITVIQAFTAGAAVNLKENFSYLLAGHVYVAEHHRRDDDTVIREFRDHAALNAALAQIGLDDARTVRRSEVMSTILFSGKRSEQAITGVDWETEESLRRRMVLLAGSIDEIVADPRALVLSEHAADRLGVEIGEEVLIRASTVTGQQNVEALVVRGVMQDAGILGSIASYAHRETVNRIINIAPESYQAVHIEVPRIEMVDGVTRSLHAALSERAAVAERDADNEPVNLVSFSFVYQGAERTPWSGSRFEVSNINDFTGQVDQLAATLNLVGTGILVVLIVITMVGVMNTFRIVMFERVREIGTMRAVGMQRSGIKRMFRWEAFFMATVGYLAGLAFAVVVSGVVSLISIPIDNAFALFTAAGTMTFPFQLGTLFVNYVVIVVLTVLAVSIPARAAARLQPADALRHVA